MTNVRIGKYSGWFESSPSRDRDKDDMTTVSSLIYNVSRTFVMEEDVYKFLDIPVCAFPLTRSKTPFLDRYTS